MRSCAAAKSIQSCPTLCDHWDGSPRGSPVPGILQARILEWVAISFSNAWKQKVKVKSLSRVRLSDPMDCSLPGSSIHGIFQARVLEWGPIAFSEASRFISTIFLNPMHMHIYDTHFSLPDPIHSVYQVLGSSTSLQLTQIYPFYDWVILHCIYVPQLPYPFICWWTSRLLLS